MMLIGPDKLIDRRERAATKFMLAVQSHREFGRSGSCLDLYDFLLLLQLSRVSPLAGLHLCYV